MGRSRSPPHVTSAAGLGAGHESTAPSSEGLHPPCWSTGAKDMDDWLLSLQLNEQTLHGFALLGGSDRLQVAKACWCRRQSLHRVESYLQGCIRSTLERARSRASAGPVVRCPAPACSMGTQTRSTPLITSASAQSRQSAVSGTSPSAARAAVLQSISAVPVRGPHPGSTGTYTMAAPMCAAASRSEVPLPTWAREAHAVLPCKRSFLAKVIAALNVESRHGLLHLSPDRQFWVAFALTLHPGAWSDPNPNALSLVTNLKCLGGSPGSQVQATAPTVRRKPLIVLHVGSCPAISVLALEKSLHLLRSREPGCDVVIVEQHGICSEGLGQAVLTQLVEVAGVPVAHWSSVSDLLPAMAESKTRWLEEGAWILCMVNLPRAEGIVTTQTSQEVRDQTQLTEEVMQDVRKLFLSCTPEFDTCTYFHVICSASRLSGTAAKVASMLATSELTADPLHYHSRMALCAISLTAQLDRFPYVSQPAPAAQLAHGFTQVHATSSLGSDGSRPSMLSARLLRLIDVQFFNERELSMVEQRCLQEFLFESSAVPGPVYLPRPCLYAEAGLIDLPLVGILDSVLPCGEWIVPATGMTVPRNPRCGEPCGKSRLCLPCSEALVFCCSMPHIAVLADAVLAVLLAAIRKSVDE